MWLGSNSKDLKVNNRLLVRDMIRKRGPIARYEIARETGLTPSTVSVIVAELLENNVIKEVGHGESSGGRRPILLELNPTAAYVLAVRIQRGEAVIAIFDLNQEILGERYCQFNTDLPEQVVEAVGQSFEELVSELKISPQKVLWCGVASPGLVSSHTGVVERSSNLGWINIPLSTMLTERLGGIPVNVENISNAAALAEKEYGLARGRDHVVFINLSVGIGAGIVAGGDIYGGLKGFAGEIGHVHVLDDGPLCTCGQRGCFEAVCGLRAILEKAKAVIPDETLQVCGKTRDNLTLNDLITKPLADSPEVQGLISETGRTIGMVISNLVNLLNPELVVLGGELSRLGQPLCDAVRAEVYERTLEEIQSNLSIEISDIKGSAPLMGAYVLALEQIFALEEWGFHKSLRNP